MRNILTNDIKEFKNLDLYNEYKSEFLLSIFNEINKNRTLEYMLAKPFIDN